MMTLDLPITVIGGGLAGCEAAWQLLRRGHRVRLCEMKPERFSPAHKSPLLAELVCSNSLGSEEITSGKGLIKEELRILGSPLMRLAGSGRVPAGKALAVDRERFGSLVTEAVQSRPDVAVRWAEVTGIPDGPQVILACGPLPPDGLAGSVRDFLGDGGLYFYDAISAIVEAEKLQRRVWGMNRPCS